MYRRKVMGVLVVQNKEPQDFSEAAESFLVTLCAQLSGVIAHAHAVGNIDVFRKPTSGSSYKTFQGVSGAGGIALGRAIVLYPPADLAAIPDREAEDISDELDLLDQAIAAVRLEIQSLDEKMQDSLMSEERALFSVFLRMLDENALPSEIKDHIRAGSWAQGAVRKVIDKHVALFAQMEDDYLRERVSDLKDLGRRILACLQENDSSHRELSPDSILIGEEISTAALVELPVDKIAAIVTSEGAANSHMVIVARALGIPTVVGVTELPINTLDDIEMIVDAYQGRVFVNPPRRLRQRYKEVQKEEEQIAKDLKQYETRDAITPDGVEIPLFVNTDLIIDALDRLENVENGFRAKAFNTNRLLSIGISKHLLGCFGSSLVSKFDFIDFTFGTNEELFDLVNSKKIDFAIVTKQYDTFDTLQQQLGEIKQVVVATPDVDMIIITYPEFEAEAKRHAENRKSSDGLTILVVTPEQVYNEFSSGAQDPTAIRDYMRAVYKKTEGEYPKYLLLFGRPSNNNE
jgi:phosphohistidine swiveling domain-containing protein